MLGGKGKPFDRSAITLMYRRGILRCKRIRMNPNYKNKVLMVERKSVEERLAERKSVKCS